MIKFDVFTNKMKNGTPVYIIGLSKDQFVAIDQK